MFFLATYDKLQSLDEVVQDEARKAGHPPADMGIYLQPLVQGTSCHCEYSLFYDPENRTEANRIRRMSNW